MPGNGEMTCYLLLHNRNGEYTLWGNELEKYRTRIFERVDLMRDRVVISVTEAKSVNIHHCNVFIPLRPFEQLDAGLPDMAAIYPQSPPAEDMAGVFLSWRRPPASHAITGSKEGGFYAGTSATDADAVMSSVDRETRQLQLLLVMGVDDSLGGVVRLNGTLYPRLPFPQPITASWSSVH